MIKITLNDTQAVKSLQQIANQLQNPRRLYGIWGETLKKIHTDRFKAEIDPEGKKWKPLSPMTLAEKKGAGILRESGNLSNKTAYNINSDGVEFGSAEIYARLHQFGGVIRPKTKKILKTKGGRFLRKATIPARPWLGVSKKNEDYLLAKTEHFIRHIISRG
ncbi:phage virion morphogenesis protein [Pasteurella multocida]|uniref:phage virion morphogenesis protein n=1 Tax=Pasteurella multocida TaxID=747 RepID=UPI00147F05E7|nr:phage virion morphogenesis protein [Pasteurella multocida]NNI07723.1 phage virion morphogenesis protein [Pasteurella multocida]NNI33465.1 phage virion morphogenesis protein [Pasteurella multocida]